MDELDEWVALAGMDAFYDGKAWAGDAFAQKIRLVPDWSIPENEPAICCHPCRIEGEEYDLVLCYEPKESALLLMLVLEHKGPGFFLTACFHLQRLQALLVDDGSLRRAHFGIRKTFGKERALGQGIDPDHWLTVMENLSRELEDYGIGRELSVPAFDVDSGTEAACDELSQLLIRQVEQRQELEEQGYVHLVRAHNAIPDSLVNETAMRMLENLSEALLTPPQSLIELLRLQLRRTGDPAFMPKTGEERKNLAALLIASDPSLSARAIGKALGVAHTTVMAWKKQPEFQEQVRTSPTITNVDVLLKKLVS